MLFNAIISFLLLGHSICYTPQLNCTELTFGKCSVKKYCGITDTGSYNCLPCQTGKLCPGDGYIYLAPQLNEQNLNHNTLQQIAKISKGTYIVSSDPSNRILFRKKLKRLVKIAKVGLTVAAIAKTGGVAALKKAAAAKAKEIAIKKGIQCLKNGLSNFCNGKKKGAKLSIPKKLGSKPKIGGLGQVVKKTKPQHGSISSPTPKIKRVSKTVIKKTTPSNAKNIPSGGANINKKIKNKNKINFQK